MRGDPWGNWKPTGAGENKWSDDGNASWSEGACQWKSWDEDSSQQKPTGAGENKWSDDGNASWSEGSCQWKSWDEDSSQQKGWHGNFGRNGPSQASKAKHNGTAAGHRQSSGTGIGKKPSRMTEALSAWGVAPEDSGAFGTQAEHFADNADLQSLVGNWKDTKGSEYDVFVAASSPDQSLNVRTRRPNGQVVETEGLIRLEAAGKSSRIVWGSRPSFVLEEFSENADTSTLVWTAPGGKHRPFRWKRMRPVASSTAAEAWPSWAEVEAEAEAVGEDAWPDWVDVMDELETELDENSPDFIELCNLLSGVQIETSLQ